MITIIRRPRIETIDCALMEDERSGNVIVCMPLDSISAAGAEALSATLSEWHAGRAFSGAALPFLAVDRGHV